MSTVISLNELTAAPQGADTRLTGTCETHGDYSVEAFYLSGTLRNPNPRCPRCVIDEGAEQGRAEAKEMRKTGTDLLQKRSQIELRMAGCKIANYEPTTAKAKVYKQICRDFVDSWGDPSTRRGNLIMVGKPGTGKTHLGCAIASAVMSQHGDQAIYTRADDLASYVRGSYSGLSGYSETDAIRRFGECPLLVLDELGGTVAKDHERSLLSRVIDMRYSKLLPTITMSNLPVAELEAATDERLMDRLRDNATVMVFDWQSHRGSA